MRPSLERRRSTSTIASRHRRARPRRRAPATKARESSAFLSPPAPSHCSRGVTIARASPRAEATPAGCSVRPSRAPDGSPRLRPRPCTPPSAAALAGPAPLTARGPPPWQGPMLLRSLARPAAASVFPPREHDASGRRVAARSSSAPMLTPRRPELPSRPRQRRFITKECPATGTPCDRARAFFRSSRNESGERIMNKGTAIVGFLLSFLTGMGLMWGIALNRGVEIGAEVASKGGGGTAESHAGSPIPIAEDDPVWGKADAPVTIVEISDFECPFCSRVVPTIAQVKQEYGQSKVRIVWKHNPLSSHQNARPAAEAAATVHGLGGDFWKFHDLVFANQRTL